MEPPADHDPVTGEIPDDICCLSDILSGDLWGIKQIEIPTWTNRECEALEGLQLTVVGTEFRTQEVQTKWAAKNRGNMVLLVPEPGNPYDQHNAIAVYAAFANGTSFDWTHVGYVERHQAAHLRKRSNGFNHGPSDSVWVAKIVDKPARRTGITLTGEVRKFRVP